MGVVGGVRGLRRRTPSRSRSGSRSCGLTSRTTSNASTPGTAAERLAAAARKSASSGDAESVTQGRRKPCDVTAFRCRSRIAGRAYTVPGCRKFSRSRTTSPPSWPASATACSARCASGSHCTIRLRGNQLTLEGDDTQRRRGACGRRRARRAGRGRPRDRPRHGRRRARRARPGRGHPRRLRGRRLAAPRHEDRAEDGQPEALRRRDPLAHDHVRDRPGGHRQDLPGDGARGRGALRAGGRPDHPHAAGGRGGRAARLPARATCWPRSTRTCARSTTRSTTCSTPTA